MAKVKSKQAISSRNGIKLPTEFKMRDESQGVKVVRLNKEIQSLKESLAQKEFELNQLRELIRYKDQQLASKDLELETYKKISDEKIILLEAKIKELESKLKKSRLQK